MTIFQVELIDPRAKALLEDLAKMNLIKIKEVGDQKVKFDQLLTRLRSKSKEEIPSLEDIAKEVEGVRSQRSKPNGSTK